MNNKLIFGTAQFAGNYGFINNKKNFSKKNIIKILNYLIKKKIYSLDTSVEYKNVDKKIKFSKFNNWKIITKINLNRFKNFKSEEKIINALIKLLKNNAKNIGVKKIEILLLHNAEILFKRNGNQFFLIIKKLKELGYIKKFGYSIYNFNNLEKLVNNFQPDVIQCPYNIFDTRLNNRKIIKLLKKNNIEVHARSIFLQGLLLLKFENLPKKFLRWKKIFKKWDEWTKKNNCSKLEVCVNFALYNDLIDKIVFGVQDLKQLKQILKVKVKKRILLPKDFSSNDPNLLNPSKWLN